MLDFPGWALQLVRYTRDSIAHPKVSDPAPFIHQLSPITISFTIRVPARLPSHRSLYIALWLDPSPVTRVAYHTPFHSRCLVLQSEVGSWRPYYIVPLLYDNALDLLTSNLPLFIHHITNHYHELQLPDTSSSQFSFHTASIALELDSETTTPPYKILP